MDGEHVAPREVPTEIAKLRSNVYRAMLIQAVPSLESSHRVGRAGGVHLPAGISLFGRAAIPADSLHPIAPHSATVRVHPAEVVLPIVVSLFGGASEPADGFGIVPRDPATVPVHDAEVALREGIALVGGAAVPADSCLVVPLHPTTLFCPPSCPCSAARRNQRTASR